MPIQPFGQADPIYDSLRVPSNQSIWNGPNDSGNTGGGLENKIYLWPSDASTISTYDPTEAGLDAAITAAAAGDTIWLPSIEIACTTQKTIPASVALRGISHNAILNFSGFADPCIILSADSVIEDFSLNHDDGKWFDASADGSKALRIHGAAYRAIIGIDTAPRAREVWLATADDIFWLDLLTSTWHKITPGLGTQVRFFTTNDGAALYLYIYNTGWYKLTTPKTSLASSQIYDDSADHATHNGISDGTNLHILQPVNYVARSWKFSTYNGSTWAYGGTYTVSWFQADVVGKDFTCLWDQVWDSTGTRFENGTDDYRGEGDGWVNSNGTRFVVSLRSGHLYLHTPGVGDVLDYGATGDPSRECSIRGAMSGPHVMAIDHLGIMHYSANGSSFATGATWLKGFAYDDKLTGGGDAIWAPVALADNGVPARVYDVSTWDHIDLTNNFWSLTSGSKTIIGMGLVYQ